MNEFHYLGKFSSIKKVELYETIGSKDYLKNAPKVVDSYKKQKLTQKDTEICQCHEIR